MCVCLFKKNVCMWVMSRRPGQPQCASHAAESCVGVITQAQLAWQLITVSLPPTSPPPAVHAIKLNQHSGVSTENNAFRE